jgi:hypothetical protein
MPAGTPNRTRLDPEILNKIHRQGLGVFGDCYGLERVSIHGKFGN